MNIDVQTTSTSRWNLTPFIDINTTLDVKRCAIIHGLLKRKRKKRNRNNFASISWFAMQSESQIDLPYFAHSVNVYWRIQIKFVTHKQQQYKHCINVYVRMVFMVAALSYQITSIYLFICSFVCLLWRTLELMSMSILFAVQNPNIGVGFEAYLGCFTWQSQSQLFLPDFLTSICKQKCFAIDRCTLIALIILFQSLKWEFQSS